MLTETEILDCLRTNLRKAIEHCDTLAVTPERGPVYREFRKELKLIEGACRQAGHWRRDARWLQIGMMMEEAHQRSLRWINKTPSLNSRKISHGLFKKLADNMRVMEVSVNRIETSATNQVGAILPKPLPAPIRTSGRPVQVPSGMKVTPGGIIL